MNRRRFLATGIVALSTSAACRVPGAATARTWGSARPSRDRIGLQLSSVRDALARDLAGTLAAVAGIGYAEVELFSPYLFGARAPHELRAALDRAGLVAVSTHVSTGLLYRGWERHLAAATTLGCRYVVCGNVASEERRTARDWHELAAVFNRAGQAARAAGLRFGYHNNDYEFARVQDVIPYDVLLMETDPMLVSFELDLAGVGKSGGDPLVVLGRAPSRFFALHVGPPSAARRTAVGSPDSPPNQLERVLDRARAGGVEHVIIECDAQPAADQVEQARRSYESLRRLAR
jgi:sugar phosphate isomerase/epimerase